MTDAERQAATDLITKLAADNEAIHQEFAHFKQGMVTIAEHLTRCKGYLGVFYKVESIAEFESAVRQVCRRLRINELLYTKETP